MPDYSKNFLNSMTGFINFNDNPVSVDSGDNPGGTKPPAQRIPLPDYNKPESRLSYAKAFTQKYGPLMSGRGDTPLRINEKPGYGSDTSKNLAIKAVGDSGIDPALLYASAMEEGMSGIFPHYWKGWEKEGLQVDNSGDKEYPISGFKNFGLDTFSDNFAGLVKKGYLPADFKKKFKTVPSGNEQGEMVNTANFKDADSALMAKAAMMRMSRDDIDEFANKKGIKLSPKARDFFTLVYYNGGSGNAEKMLQSYNQSGFLKNDKFLEKRPSESWKQIYENVIRRLKMSDALKQEGYFDDQEKQNNDTAQNTK